MIQLKYYIIGCFFVFISIFFFISCSSKNNEVLLEVEKIMLFKPDSALFLLEEIKPNYDFMTDDDKAFFGLLYFQALNKNNKELVPIQLIDFSIEHYSKNKKNRELAYSYFYKARAHKKNVSPEYVQLIMNAFEKSQEGYKDDLLLGMIYSEFGFVSYYQKEYELAQEYYNSALACFANINDVDKLASTYVSIGNILVEEDNHREAHIYFNKALNSSSDQITIGTALLSLGRNYYLLNQYDWALYYVLQSLEYPCFESNKSYTQFLLADIYFDIDEYDSSIKCANEALSMTSDYITQRECYRILANAEYNINNQSNKIVYYLNKYQDYNDSINTKVYTSKIVQFQDTFLSKKKLNKANNFTLIFAIILLIMLIAGSSILYIVRKKVKKKDEKTEEYKNKLYKNHMQLKDDLKKDIENLKIKYHENRKGMPLDLRNQLEKQIYDEALFLNDNQSFIKLMNKVLNHLPDNLVSQYPNLNQKEITWCCLTCLDIPLQEIASLLDYTPSSIYKFKQRLAKKMDLNGTKELDALLNDFFT